jgi:hypothetical protein
VSLDPWDFIQSVPEQSPGLSVPNKVIGDHLGQHPGGFDTGGPKVGTFLVGVFGGQIDLHRPDADVFLWETTAAGYGDPFLGPQISLGYWDGNTFTPYGNPVNALYDFTGAPGDLPGMEIYSSVTPLGEFNIPGSPYLNAVEIAVVDVNRENQVTAVATYAIPEPSTIVLAGAAVTCLLAYGWMRKRL